MSIIHKEHNVFDQTTVIQQMIQLGYKANAEGVCFGLSMMFVQAVVVNDVLAFEARIELLAKYNAREKELSDKISKAKEKVKKQAKLTSLIKTLEINNDIKSDELEELKDILNDEIITRIHNKSFKSQDIEEISEIAENYVTESDHKFLEILSFFDGVMLYHQPHDHSEWFNRDLHQTSEMIVAPYVRSDKLAQEMRMKKVYSTVNQYTKDDLKNYFDELAKKLSKFNNIGMRFESTRHAIALSYDTNTKKWMLIDPNKCIKNIDHEHIAAKVAESLAVDIVAVALSTDIFASNKYAKEHNVQQELKVLDNIPEHAINEDNKNAILWMASREGNLVLVEKALNFGADINKRREDFVRDDTPLHVAYIYRHLDVVKKLLEKGDDINKKNDSGGNGLLHYACEYGSLAMVNELLELGADINLRNDQGDIPLHVACKMGNSNLMGSLLDHGADIHAQNSSGNTPLHMACQYGRLDIVKQLLAAGADIEQQNAQGNTPLHVACNCKFLEIVSELLKKGATVDKANKNGYTPLHVASQKGNLVLANKLLEFQADMNVGDNIGNTPLHIACTLEMVGELLAKGAAINKGNEYGNTPLHEACNKGYLDIVGKLLEEGANIDKANKHGYTPLHFACLNERSNIVNTLLEEGADLDSIDDIRSELTSEIKELVEKHERELSQKQSPFSALS